MIFSSNLFEKFIFVKGYLVEFENNQLGYNLESDLNPKEKTEYFKMVITLGLILKERLTKNLKN